MEQEIFKSKKGRFIVIDGSDGSGKGTQSDLLIARLKAEGQEVAYYDFPQYYDSFFGKMVGEFLVGKFGRPERINPYIASLLYAGDRWQASQKMKADLEAGKIVVSNRYTSSNMAHQAGKIKNKKDKEEYLNWLQQLEFEVYGIPKPDLVIYLYAPLKISQQLLEKKGERGYVGKVKDKVESNKTYLDKSIKEYLRLAERYPEWIKIDCVKDGQIESIETISDKIFNIVQTFVPQKAETNLLNNSLEAFGLEMRENEQ